MRRLYAFEIALLQRGRRVALRRAAKLLLFACSLVPSVVLVLQ
jgi:hypothetical protein